MQGIQDIVSSPYFIITWAILMIPSLIIVIRALRVNNAHLMPLMKVVWGFTVAYSGPLGLLIYWLTGRKEISDDNDWRRAFRSVAHCYSGCGMGEIVGVLIAVGLLSLGNLWTALITFVLAYVAGFALTIGPEMQGGTAFRQAFHDALLAETPSIAVMEVVAIGVDLLLAGNAGMGDWKFWSSLVISLTCGLLAAYPVNLLLIRHGVKEGMMDPRMTDHHA
ncbi:DUF4396 domain-containing protein [Pseudooceanicola sediminis]|uniref:DUF4396 domain-containing protein n=1 Tax=Pseudooceanicola sediminis TaxID=2211117 RepID=A0A399IVM5_9RHOB|nr:DUF4396 domain-containing protein [Pseudooceanicola sediminis]KAA2312694.1 DUF4396 domain-containing protein [Puniceibacterium sp. HSS470]RII37091.1 DUF4396 domain-containing protein [Pseudooceanicola sediminis]|tara:strand:- start:13640 stop:14302 length:663 start_codon:yes stop_codon:yes gene_type:complete